jgi:hypothetical protein
MVESTGTRDDVCWHLRNAQLVVANHRHPVPTGAALDATGLNILHHSKIPIAICHPGLATW